MNIKKKYAPTFYIPIEIKDRELNSQLLLSFYLVINKKCRVYIGSKRAIHRVLENKKIKGGTYIYKGCHDEKYSKFIKNKCNQLLILDQELSPNDELVESLAKIRIIPESIPYIDKYFVVNETIKNSIAKIYPELDHRICASGWPRIEILQSKYNDLYQNDVSQIQNQFGSYILFASDFGILSESCIENRSRQEKEHINRRPDLSLDDAYDQKLMHSFMHELESTITFLKELSSIESLPIIIIRPHPSEDESIWHSIFNNHKNILIESSGDITYWIKGSKALIHRGSSSAVQAFALKTPSFYFVSDENVVRKNISYKISNKIKSANEFLSSFYNSKSEFFDLDNDNQTLKELPLKAESCSKIISNINFNLIQDERPYSKNILYGFQSKIIDFCVNNLKRSSKYNIQSEKNKLGEFGIVNDEVKFPISVFSELYDSKSTNISVKKIQNNLYQINKKE